MARYQRQMILPGFGEQGQQQIRNARVLVVGAGGLGCPALLYLTAAGIGTIGIVDGDCVSESNLHRQVLYGNSDIGKPKASVAHAFLQQQNPDIQFVIYPEYITPHNAADCIQPYDLVIDGTDNFATRYLLNDACFLLKKPLIYGAISQFEGQVAVFNGIENGIATANYRDLFPVPPAAGSVLNCAEAGVIGVLPGIIGTLQATEAIKMITGIGQPLINQIFTYNLLNNRSLILKITPMAHIHQQIPASLEQLKNTNYEWFCNGTHRALEIDASQLHQLIQTGNVQIIDIRQAHEMPKITQLEHQAIPLAHLNDALFTANTVVFICQTGKRSLHAALQWQEKSHTIQFLSLNGGVLGL